MRKIISAGFIIAILCLLQSCSPQSGPPDGPEKADSPERIDYQKLINCSLDDILLTDKDVGGNYLIKTSSYSGRKALSFLKKPRQDVEIVKQVFSDPDNPDETRVITLLLLKFGSSDLAETETKINFSILENLLKKADLSVEEFEINVLGDESMGIVFSGRKYPLYLYCRIHNYLIKLNGGSKRQMEELINLVKVIERKLRASGN